MDRKQVRPRRPVRCSAATVLRRALVVAMLLALCRDIPTRSDEGDGLWSEVAADGLAEAVTARSLPRAYRTSRLDAQALRALLAGAPLEFTLAADYDAVEITMPMPDGSRARFRVIESPVMKPALASRYPEIKTYGGQGLDDPAAVIRFDTGPRGLHAIILATGGTVFVEPHPAGYPGLHISYFGRDDPAAGAFDCLEAGTAPSLTEEASSGAPEAAIAGNLRIYDLAAAATAEYTAQNGGTVAGALSAITTTINTVNAIYRRDLGIFLSLVDNNDTIIYTDANTDPYTSGDLTCDTQIPACGSADCLLTENQCNLDATIGSANYDLGIVFDRTDSSGGGTGRASIGVACNAAMKGRGATAGNFVLLAAHEIAHQINARHTFNNNANGACATLLGSPSRDASSAYEPGSGSSIMSYAGSCDSANLQSQPDDAFHSMSIIDMDIFADQAGRCWDSASTGNAAPVIRSHTAGPYHVPSQTPFALSVEAYDPNGDALTYSWEQADLGAASPPEGDDGTRPILRAYAPTVYAERWFPSKQYVVDNANIPPASYNCGTGTCLTGETLPTTTRAMDFHVLVRDNVDGWSIASTVVFSEAGSGPFTVTSPNGNPACWVQGTPRTVSWNVANTSSPPVSAANVRISLSEDGGSTFPYVLAASTPNDGSETVLVPWITTHRARVKVEAVGNVFFDLSDNDFSITPLRVTNTSDSGCDSLRQAILDANAEPQGRTIPFAIPGSGVKTIQLATPLPNITSPSFVDGLSQGGPDYVGLPLIQLSGTGCAPYSNGSPANGLVVAADNVTVQGLAIHGFAGSGVVIQGSASVQNMIRLSHIGADATGTAAPGNGAQGVHINGAPDNFVFDNVISGNQVGVLISGIDATGNVIRGNRIGTDKDGAVRLPNKQDGVRISGAPGNFVGGSKPDEGNTIAGNGTFGGISVLTAGDGIEITGTAASGNVIEGNRIGLNDAGTAALDNTDRGIRIVDAPNTLIGGTVPGAGNFIADRGALNYFAGNGIEISGLTVTGTVIQGNSIGLDASGTFDLGTRGYGIYIEGAANTAIGGTAAGARNVISGNNNGGIRVGGATATGTVIQGNYIGTNAAGSAAVGNAASGGILLESGGTLIGGTAPGAGNLISGNTYGIFLNEVVASNNVIQGNYIGIDATGMLDLGNTVYGIYSERGANNTIGGTTPGARNVISGNDNSAIFMWGSPGSTAPGNVIQGNYIGTNAAGTAAIANARGIQLSDVTDFTIGGAAPGAGNVISGSSDYGISVHSFDVTTSGIVIQGNRIGTDASGTVAIGNAGRGIVVTIRGGLTIGGSAAGAGNLVSGNGIDGIFISGSNTTGVVVRGNRVGTDAGGTASLPNGGSGIIVSNSASNTIIGGIGPGEGNVVAFSAPPGTGTNHAGVKITFGTGNSVRGNSIHSNTGLGIDIGGLGLTANDACDPDTGANNQQNFPLLSSAVSGASTTIDGSLNSTANTTFTLDFYASPSCDPSGNGEGATYLGSTNVTTDSSCNAGFSVNLPVPSSGVATATATDAAGNTSEFSACRTIEAAPLGEIAALSWAAGTKDTLTWSADPGASLYRLFRGVPADLANLLNSNSDCCVRYEGSATTTGPILVEDPASVPGRFYWYLVVGANAGGNGPAGNATAGPRVVNPTGPCP